MALKFLTGVSGGLTIPATEGPSTVHFYRWACRLIRAIFEDSNFDGATNAKTKIGGMCRAEGTFEGTADSASMPTIGTIETEHDAGGTSPFVMILDSVFSTDMAISFNALLRDVTITTPKRDRIIVTGGFVSAAEIVAGNFIKGVT